jgi:hypothetical protein
MTSPALPNYEPGAVAVAGKKSANSRADEALSIGKVGPYDCRGLLALRLEKEHLRGGIHASVDHRR